ncbi:DUF2079 domain-containing protein [Kineococcus rubinsiae]|uniref:DUF2079 domain-containing protein n=1 Tax=Kineococcus rubinsiae TaxID=2609562 RepID=UPI001431FFE8|nr:DUF2079 domain-containing protein [Kineococcus rubinsiae]NIZ91552.1 DUF2079 domain-containing protein [Kineococcus rubinsiae]
MPPRPARLLTLAAGVVSVLVCAGIGTGRYQAGEAHTYDLAIFSQSAQSWAQLRWPTADVLAPGRPLLGDHFSPATVVFGLAWRLWADPRSLLLLQALLLGLGTALVARCAARHLRTVPAVAVAVGALLAHGTLAAARFDVHEVALAVPLLALSGTALLERRDRAAALWSLPLLLVKEDMGATVLAVAAVLWLRGARRLGVRLALVAVLGVAVALATMWAVDPDHDLSRVGSFSDPGSGVLPRLGLVAAVVAGGGLLWVASPIALLALPTLAWRLVSSQPSYWSSQFHYDAVLVPVAAVALVDVLRRHPRRQAPLAVLAALACVATTAVVLDVRTLPSPLAASTWRPSPVVTDLRAAARAVPAGAPLAADNTSGAYLVTGHRVSTWSPDQTDAELGPWVVLDTARSSLSTTPAQKAAWIDAAVARGGEVVARVGATSVLRLPVAGSRATPAAEAG